MPLDLLTRLDPLRRLRCPFCFDRFSAFEMHFKCDDPYCKTDYARMIDDPILTKAISGRSPHGSSAPIRSPWWVDPLRDPRRGIRRFFDWMLMPGSLSCPNCRRPTDLHLCPRCHSRLPDKVVTLNAGHIAIFGPQSVGKTTFVTVLLHELDHRVGPERGFVLDPLTDEIRDRYDREYHSITYGSSGLGIGDDFAMRQPHEATRSLEMNRISLQPLIYRLTTRTAKGKHVESLLSFFDTAGEDWEMNIELLRSEAKYIGQARGLLFLIDPLRIREVALDPRLSLTDQERHVPAATYLSDIRKLVTFFARTPVETPIAIVLNKLDRWGKLMPPGSNLHTWASSVPTKAPDRDLDQSIHEEVQIALRQWGSAGFLEHVALNFPNHRFFACSSLGDAAQSKMDEPQPLPTPLLIERPVLWLLEREGLLKA